MTYFPLRQTTCFFIPLVAPCKPLLGILKITQDNNRDTWRMVPLQDFTAHSDIDWSKSVAEIDRQLYRKYDLTADEIEFIETHVKEMA